GPDVREAVDAEGRVDLYPPALIEREAELPKDRVRPRTGRPDERARDDPVAVGEDRLVRTDRLQRRADADVDASPLELVCCVLAEPRRDLGQDPGRGVDEHPVLRGRAELVRVVAERVAREV